MRRRPFLLLAAAFWALLGWAVAAAVLAEAPANMPADANPTFRLSGNLQWAGGYAWGDAAGLENRKDVLLGQLSLKQRIALDVQGKLPPALALNAHVDNERSESLQLLTFSVENEAWRARVGDFYWQGLNPYVAYGLSLKGVDLTAVGQGPWWARGFFAQGQGIPSSKTFTGGASSDQVVYKDPSGPYSPIRQNKYLTASILGAYHYGLAGVGFDPDFYHAWVKFGQATSALITLQEFLVSYGLGYLGEAGGGGGSAGVLVPGTFRRLLPGNYAVAERDGREYLVLRQTPEAILRLEVMGIINEYNREHNLRGEAAKQYPFVENSGLEEQFLGTLLRDYAFLRVARQPEGDGPEAGILYPGAGDPGSFAPEPREGRGWGFFDLGNRGIELGSVQVEVLARGLWQPAEQVAGFSYRVYHDAGLICLQLPQSGGWEPAEGQVRVQYKYRVTDNVYTLGMSVMRGSERVYLNGALLRRDVDYTIDYETGILIVLKDVGSQDVLRVDYEFLRSGLGVANPYQQNVYGASAGWTKDHENGIEFDVIQAADRPLPAAEQQQVPVMPGTHTVVGANARLKEGGFTGQANLAYSREEFPFDDNRRVNLANEVTAVAVGERFGGQRYVLFGHRGGLTVYLAPTGPFGGDEAAGTEPGYDGPGEWRLYTAAAGLAGNSIQGIAESEEAWYIATDGGLTRVAKAFSIIRGNLFDETANWRRYYAADGLPSNRVTSVAVDAITGRVWAGTESGLAWADEGQLQNWRRVEAGLPSPQVTALATNTQNGLVLVGTTSGLALMKADGGGVAETLLQGMAIQAVVPVDPGTGASSGAENTIAFVATADGGLWRLVENVDTADYAVEAFSPPPAPILGLAWLAGDRRALYAATPDGLYESLATTELTDTDWRLVVSSPGGRVMTAVAAASFPAAPGDEVWLGSRADASDLPLWRIHEPGSTQFPATQTGIPLVDAEHYADLDPEAHTAQGAAARVNLEQALGPLAFWLNYESLQPGFTSIGRLERQDLRQWAAGGRLDLGNGLPGFSLEHKDKAARKKAWNGDWEAKPARTVTNGAAVSWAPVGTGVRLRAEAALNQVDRRGDPAFDDFGRSVGVAAEGAWWENRFRWSLGYEKSQLAPTWNTPATSTSEALSGRATAILLPGLTLDLQYRKPFQILQPVTANPTVGPSDATATLHGTESRDWSVTWNNQSKSRLQTTAAFHQHLNDVFSGKAGEAPRKQKSYEANLGAYLRQVSIGSLRLNSGVSGRWSLVDLDNGHPRDGVSAQAYLRGGNDRFLPQLSLTYGRTRWPIDQKMESEARLAGGISYVLTPRLTPGVDFSFRERRVVRPDLGQHLSRSGSWSASVAWTPWPFLTSNSQVSWSQQYEPAEQTYLTTYGLWEKVEVALGDRWRLRLGGDYTRNAGVSGGKNDDSRRLEADTGATYRFTDVWSAGVDLTLIHGQKPPQGPYTTYLAQIKIQACF